MSLQSSTSTAPHASALALDAAREQGRAALIAYLPVGYPDVPTSQAALQAALDAGADIVEVGMPYSDPLMDGPVIQRAADEALRKGVHTADVLRVVEGLTSKGGTAVVMTYWNLVDHYGVEAFARDLAAAGGAGLVTPDLIPDEAGEWISASDTHDLERIFLAAPSSTPERLKLTAAAARGWVYAASMMGVTGSGDVPVQARELVQRTRDAGAARVCVGLGVSTPEQARTVAAYADGVIVGSAFVRALGDAATPAQGVLAVGRLTEALRVGIDAAERDVTSAI